MAALMTLSIPGLSLAAETAVPAKPAATTPAPPKAMPPGATPEGDKLPAGYLTEAEAIARVKQFFKLPEGPGRLVAHLNKRGDSHVWQLMYQIDSEHGSSSHGVGVVDAKTGRIEHFSLPPDYLPIRTGPIEAEYPESLARAWAWSLVTAMYPEESKSLHLAPANQNMYYYGSSVPDRYTFTWSSREGEIPVPFNSVTVTADRVTGDFLSLHANFQPVEYLNKEAKVTAEEALTAFRAEPAMQLAYQHVYDRTKPPTENREVKLVYRPAQPLNNLDAETGKFLNYDGQTLEPAGEPIVVEPNPAVALEPLAAPVEAKKLEEFVRKVMELPKDVQVRVDDEMYYYPSRPNHNIHVNWHDPESNKGGSMVVDRRNGMIMSMNRHEPYYGGPPEAVRAEERAKAQEEGIAIVQRYYGAIAAKLKLQPAPQSQYEHGVHLFFQRYENGIPVSSDGLRVSFNPGSATWSSVYLQWSDVTEFPDPKQAIDAARAEETYFGNLEPKLTFMAIHERNARYTPYERPTLKARLVYQLVEKEGVPFTRGLTVDAISGELIDHSGMKPAGRPGAEHFAKLKGHANESELRYMMVRGAMPADVDPSARMTRAETIKALVVGLRGDYYGYRYYGPFDKFPFVDVQSGTELGDFVIQGLNRGWYTAEGEKPAFGPEKEMNRLEFAMWVARALGFGKLVKSSLNVSPTYTDIEGLSADQRNALALLQAVGVLEEGTSFRPGDTVTQAEAAATVVRMLIYVRQ